MATRSNIGIEYSDGKIETIYCHYDGYPEHMVPLLENYHYNDVRELLEQGDMSYLRKFIHPTTDSHDFNNPEPDICLFYARDRGEPLYENPIFDDRSEALKEEFLYLYLQKENKWIYTGSGSNWLKNRGSERIWKEFSPK